MPAIFITLMNLSIGTPLCSAYSPSLLEATARSRVSLRWPLLVPAIHPTLSRDLRGRVERPKLSEQRPAEVAIA